MTVTSVLLLAAVQLLVSGNAQTALRGAGKISQSDAAANETAVSRVPAMVWPDAVLLDGTLLQDNSTDVKSDIDLDKDKELAMLYKTNWWGPQVHHYPSGHTVVHHPSGHTVVHHPSGHAVVHHPSGHTVVHHPSGHTVVHHPWGGVTVHHPWNFAAANATLRVPQVQGDASANETAVSRVPATVWPDAVLLDSTLLQDNSTDVKSDIDLDKDKELAMLYKTNWWGPQVHHYPSGHTVVHHPSGHTVVHHPSGHAVVHHPSGHTVVHHPSGHTVVHHPWGGVTVHPPMWR